MAFSRVNFPFYSILFCFVFPTLTGWLILTFFCIKLYLLLAHFFFISDFVISFLSERIYFPFSFYFFLFFIIYLPLFQTFNCIIFIYRKLSFIVSFIIAFLTYNMEPWSETIVTVTYLALLMGSNTMYWSWHILSQCQPTRHRVSPSFRDSLFWCLYLRWVNKCREKCCNSFWRRLLAKYIFHCSVHSNGLFEINNCNANIRPVPHVAICLRFLHSIRQYWMQ
jgi:hypothetical protein